MLVWPDVYDEFAMSSLSQPLTTTDHQGDARRRRVAVIGSGVSGLGACWRLKTEGLPVHVTLLEADAHFGGHAHTQDITLEGQTFPVDTGFLVYNERTYPSLIDLFAHLQVPVAPSDMSFSVQVRSSCGSELEWSGSSLATVFAQRSNLFKPRFWGMLSDILRFNRLATALAQTSLDSEQPVQRFLDEHRFGANFREHYLLPMIGCIWSCPVDQMLQFPMATLLRFCHNHGLLQVSDRPQWYTIKGGSRQYVQKIVELLDEAHLNCPVRSVHRSPKGVEIDTGRGLETYDAVVFATHPDQTLGMLAQGASALEREVLGKLSYQANRAVLHTDARMLPTRRSAWAAWNYERSVLATQAHAPVCLHYWINRLQPLPWATPVMVSLNPIRPIPAEHVHAEMEYEHPVFDGPAIRAQARVPELQGHLRSWFCGAWCAYGFHEDGLNSGLRAADLLTRALATAGAAHD